VNEWGKTVEGLGKFRGREGGRRGFLRMVKRGSIFEGRVRESGRACQETI